MYTYFLMFISSWVPCDAGLRVIGGRDAARDEFPYAVRLEFMRTTDSNNNIEYERFCTGAAINSEWILSAAHCFDENDVIDENDKIIARYNSYFPNYKGKISPIIEFHVHPRYAQMDLPREHDIGLFRSQNISVAQYAKISAVDYKSLVGYEVDILGFGGTNASDMEKPLQVLRGMIMKCGSYESNGISHLCVVTRCGLEATICSGDSGGPIVHYSGIIGVNSRSFDDCNEFTKSIQRTYGYSASIVAVVSDTTDWIMKIISGKKV